MLLDFHGTIAQVEDPVGGCTSAAPACGATLDRGRPPSWPTGSPPPAGPAGRGRTGCRPHLAEVWADRDLPPHAHRAAYTGPGRDRARGIEGLAEAAVRAAAVADGWQLYADTVPTLQALRARRGAGRGGQQHRLRPARPRPAELGFADLVDAFVLSYEVGRCKPDPAIFRNACAALRRRPGAHADGRRHPGRRGRGRRRAAASSSCRRVTRARSTVSARCCACCRPWVATDPAGACFKCCRRWEPLSQHRLCACRLPARRRQCRDTDRLTSGGSSCR